MKVRGSVIPPEWDFTSSAITVYHRTNMVKITDDDGRIEYEYDEEYARELEKYGISNGCNSENEILIFDAKFKVLSIEDDELYGKRDEDGAPGIRIINVEMIK